MTFMYFYLYDILELKNVLRVNINAEQLVKTSKYAIPVYIQDKQKSLKRIYVYIYIYKHICYRFIYSFKLLTNNILFQQNNLRIDYGDDSVIS